MCCITATYYLSGTGLPWFSWKRSHLTGVVVVVVVVVVVLVVVVIGWVLQLQEISLSPVLSHDPLPPLDSVASYTRPPRYVRGDY